jgi:hypothetical protein
VPLPSVSEQVARQSDRAHALTLLDLAEQRLKAHPHGIGLQLSEEPGAAVCVVHAFAAG